MVRVRVRVGVGVRVIDTSTRPSSRSGGHGMILKGKTRQCG